MKVYLAAPFFDKTEINIYNQVIGVLRGQGHEVFVPQEHTVPGAWDMTNANWGKAVFKMDKLAIHWADCVVCLNYGLYSDSGTAWECGYAEAQNIPVAQILCAPPHETPYSLMMLSSATVVMPIDDFLNGENIEQAFANQLAIGNYEVK